jgi:ribonuclease P protein component
LDFSFKKAERLSSQKAIESLIKSGSVHFLFPLRVVWMVTDFPIPGPAQVAFSVPKKRFKRANKRNLIKRRLREAYRLNKNNFYQDLNQKGIHIQLLIVYIAPEILSYQKIEPKIISILEYIMANVQKTT